MKGQILNVNLKDELSGEEFCDGKCEDGSSPFVSGMAAE